MCRSRGSARQGTGDGHRAQGTGDAPPSALHGSPGKGGSRRAQRQGAVSSWQGNQLNFLVLDPQEEVPALSLAQPQEQEPGSATQCLFCSFWLAVSSWLDFSQSKCRTGNRKCCLYHTLARALPAPALLPLLEHILCWGWRTGIAELVYPQNQCSPEAVAGTTEP